MTGLFSGIIGSLVGSGIQAVTGGIPISEDASKALDVLRVGGLPVPPVNWFSTSATSSNKQNPQMHDCEKIEQHIAGALQVIGQGMQVVKVLGDVLSPRTKAAPAKAWTPRDDLLRANASSYTSAQVHERLLGPAVKLAKNDSGCQCSRACAKKPSTSGLDTSSNTNLRDNFCFPLKPTNTEGIRKIENFGNSSRHCQKNADIYTPGRENIRQTANRNGGKPSATASKMLPKEKGRKDQLNVEGDSKDRIFCGSSVTKQSQLSNGQKKTANTQHNTCESGVQKCLYCQVQIRKVNKSGLMPCGHTFCQRCLTGQRPLKCPKCDVKYDVI
ncbi:uncharacterized protein LOC124412974 isoform X2 [Diprion similis]|uniref:uncharacterized protein LOC124412974 isoform X2 n=1 Tax=Diprion similis TaxID=362088 RepID=UPI001EF790B9|nr:uncharacterized protein LOC124412974 isoform X2 [Diprion similis]